MVLRDLQNDVASKIKEQQKVELSNSIKEIEQLESLLARLTIVGQDDISRSPLNCLTHMDIQ